VFDFLTLWQIHSSGKYGIPKGINSIGKNR